MRKTTLLLTTLVLFCVFGLKAQVGINTTNPKGTLHIIPTSTDGSTAEGIIAPNLKRSELISKDLQYGADQRGAIVYVSAIDGTITTKTAKILALGYYYFDGSLWQAFSAPVATVTAANNGLAMDGTTVQLGGALIKATSITGTAANTLTIAAPAIVSGALRVSSGTPGAGKVLTSDATGNATWGALPTAPAATVTTANNGLAMSGTTVQLGGALTKATSITGTAANTLTIGAPAIVTGALQITSGVPGAGKVLTSNAAGNATWTALPAAPVTTANNGLAMSGTTTQLGGALTKATTISGSATNTLTISAPAIVSGALRIASGTPGANKYLRSDATGNATWVALPAAPTIPTEPWQVQGGTTAATTNAQNIYQTGSVAVGTNTANGYKFQVTGTSNVTGNSRVASSTVVGAQTVGTTLAVTGTSALTGNVGIGGAANATYTLRVGGTSYVTGNSFVAGNLGLGTTSVTQRLNVAGNTWLSGLSRLGGSGTTAYNASAQLELADNNKGLLPNRVALTSITVKAPVASAVDGMLVYNTATVAAQGLIPGFYYWKANKWQKLIDDTDIDDGELKMQLLADNTLTTAYNASNVASGALLKFRGSPNGVVIPADGNYAFSFRLYGHLMNGRPASNLTVAYYIALLTGSTVIDSAEMDIIPGSVSPTATAVITYSIVLGGTFKKGQVVTFRMSHNPSSNYPWRLQGRSSSLVTGGDKSANIASMLWWKI